MSELKGAAYLKRKLTQKQPRINTRYAYYDMKHIARELGIANTPETKWLVETLGWCGNAVDCLADRLVFREFRNDNFGLNEIFSMNNPDIIFDSAIQGALISSCDFIYISKGEDGYPRLQVIDGGNATGTIDPITGLLREGYAVLERDADTNLPTLEAYFLPKETYFYRNGEMYLKQEHKVEYPLLVPIINRPDEKRPFGRSRISRACMSLQDAAVRTLKRSEITAEFYSFPQKYVTGLSQEHEEMDKWKATIASMLSFEEDENGNAPKLGQFAQASMEPHLTQLKIIASAFGGETGMTMDDLGFSTQNPSSAEAIKAAHENLRLKAKKAQRSFGSGFLNAGYLAACLRDDYNYQRSQLYLTKPIWEPPFEADASSLSGIGDAMNKLQQSFPEYVTPELFGDLTGIH